MNYKIILLGAVAPLASLQAFAQQQSSPLSQSYDCVIEPREMAEVGSQAEGVLAEVIVERGMSVKKGEILARLNTTVEETNLELAGLRAGNDAKVKSSRQRSRYFRAQNERSAKLFEEGSLSTAAAEKALTERRIAQYEVEAALVESKMADAEFMRAEALLEQKIIRAPFDGVVIDRLLSPGAYTYEQAPVYRIAQIDPLNVELYAPIDLYPHLSQGMTGTVTLSPPFNTQYNAEIAIIDKTFDAPSSTFGVRLQLANPDGAIPAGIHCKVSFRESDS